MGFLKDFMDNIVKRVSLDAKFNDSGLCINVGLKDAPVNTGRVYYSVSMHGIDNPIGGIALVMLSCSDNRLSAPFIEKEADRRLFVSGFFGDNNFPCIAPLHELLQMGEGTEIFDNGNGCIYILKYKYFNVTDLDYSDKNIVDEVILDYICTKLIPSCGKTTFVYDANMYDNRQNKLYNKIVDTCIGESSDVFKLQNINCVPLSDYIAEYYYNNMIESDITEASEIAGVKISEVPTSIKDQTAWVESLTKKGGSKTAEFLKAVCKNKGEDGK